MRVTSEASYTALIGQVQALNAQQIRYQSQAATGQRITNPEDDPAAVGRALDAQAQKSAVQQFDQNAHRALDVNQASFAGFDSVRTLSDRAGEIAALVGGTTDPVSMKAYATEVNQLMEQALGSGNGKLGNNYLFGGTATDTPPFVATRNAAGQITAVAYQGAASGAGIALDAGTTVSPFTSGKDNQGIAGFINTLATLRDALAGGNATAVLATRTALASSDDQLVNTLGNLGAMQTRIQAASVANATRFTSLANAISADASADLPQTVIQLSRAQNAYQAALQTGAKILGVSLLDYLH